MESVFFSLDQALCLYFIKQEAIVVVHRVPCALLARFKQAQPGTKWKASVLLAACCRCWYQEVYYSSSESATREEEAPGTAVTATPTSTRISHPHGEWSEWRCWYARRLQPVYFRIERPQKRTGGSIQDRIAGSFPSHIRPGDVVGYAPNRRGRTPARNSILRCHRSPPEE
jgi:hypothetical protein